MSKIYKWIIAVFACVMVLTLGNQEVEAAAKTLSVSKTKSTIFVLDSKRNTSQIKVKYGNKNVTKSCEYSVSNKKIATVSKSGKITAVKKGTATIKVKYKGKSKSFKITVKNPILSMSMQSMSIGIGESYGLVAYANNNRINNKNIAWSSSDQSIAVVSKNGGVKGIKAGKTTIIAKTQAGKIICPVNVQQGDSICKHDGAISYVDHLGKYVEGVTCLCGVSFTGENYGIHENERYANALLEGNGEIPDDYTCGGFGGPTPLEEIEPGYVEEVCQKCGKSLGITHVYDSHVHNWKITIDKNMDTEYTLDRMTTYHVKHYTEKECTTCGLKIGDYDYYTTPAK